MVFAPAARAPEQPSAQAWCFAFAGGRLLLPADGPGAVASAEPALPALADGLTRHALFGAAEQRHYLGRLADADCWALALAEPPPGWSALPLRAALATLAAPLAALAGRAAQVLEWDRTHRYCGVCGTPTVALAHERARRCPACGHTAYPRLSPAMMALVWRPGELLLARSAQLKSGMYSALAGFVEPGESLEDCLHREVAEEVGVRVADLRYYGSQSWPFPHSLMVAYSARWVGGEIVMQADEIADAQWFAADALPPIPPLLSIAGHLIRDGSAALRAGRAP